MRLIALALLLAPSLARAAAETHDGFFARLQVGPGYSRASSQGLLLKGAGLGVNIELGGAVANDLAVYGKLFRVDVPRPALQVGRVTLANDDDDEVGTHGALGAGVTYYVMPHNLYVSGGLSLTQLSLRDNGDRIDESEVGVGLHLGLGKEWWISPEWGLGVAAELATARIESQEYSTWTATSFQVFFSATYN